MNFFLNDPYLVTYENVLSDSLCDSIVKKYNYVLKNEKEKIDKLSICYKDGNKLCTACNCTRMNLMEHSIFKNDIYNIAHISKDIFKRYVKETESQTWQFPKKYNFESIKMKRYLPNTDQGFKPHIDVNSWESSKRFLAIIYYLNDDFGGGETNFIKHNLKIKPKKGMCVLFPPYWPWIHSAEMVTGNNSKYFLGTYLTYVD